MAYQFRLTTMLKLREQARDERRRELAQAYEAERILNARMTEMQAEIEATRQRTRIAGGAGSINIEELLNARRYALVMKSQVLDAEAQVKLVLEEVERRRLALLEADRDVKVLEKLRERQSDQHGELERKQENKQLDEAALRGFSRQQEATL